MTVSADSVADDIRSVWEARQKEAAAPPVDNTPEVADDTPEPDDAAREPVQADDGGDEESKAGQPRDEHGRFAKKDGDAPAETVDDGGEELDPPVDWPVDKREMFRQQPVDVQRYLLDTYKSFQSDYTKKTETVAQKEKRLSRLEEVLAPRRDEIARRGVDEATAINQLFALAEYAEKNPAEYVKWFAEKTGVDLAQMAGAKPPEADEDDAYADPQVSALKGTVAQLERKIAELTGGIQQTQAQRQEAEMAQRTQESMQQIEAFASATDAKGKPLHPYFEQVMEDMLGMVQAAKARDPHARVDLEATYQKAVWMNDETRANLQADEKAAAERERRQKARAAQQAGATVTGTPAGQSGAVPAESVRDELVRQATQAFGRI